MVQRLTGGASAPSDQGGGPRGAQCCLVGCMSPAMGTTVWQGRGPRCAGKRHETTALLLHDVLVLAISTKIFRGMVNAPSGTVFKDRLGNIS